MSLDLLRRASFWWIVFALALVLRILHRPDSHTVFPIFAAGSAHWWSGESLYSGYKPLDFFRYPLSFAIAFSPYAWLGSRAGGVLWSLTSLAVYWLGLRCLLRDVIEPRLGQHRLNPEPFLILSLLGAGAGLWNAQSNALLVGLLLLGASAVARQHWWKSALFLGLPVVLKFTPLPLVLLFVALWPRQLMPRLPVVLMAGFLLPFLTRPPDKVWQQYRGWTTHLSESATERWPGFRDGWTVFAVARHLVEGGEGLPDLKAPIDEPAYRVVQALGGLTLLIWCLVLRRRGLEARTLVLLTLAGGACWTLLLGPASEAPTYVFVAPYVAWGVTQRRRWLGVRRLVEASGLLLLVLGWAGLTRSWWDVAPWLILVLPAGVILFLIWLVLGPGARNVNLSGQCP